MSTFDRPPYQWIAAQPSIRDRTTVLALTTLSLAAAVARLAFYSSYTFEGIGRDAASYLNVASNLCRGLGWVNHSLHFLFALPERLPQPDAYWSPLFPLLIAASFKTLGIAFGSARAVSMVIGISVPGLVYVLARDLTRARSAGLVAGALAVCNSTLIGWSNRVQPEIASVFLVVLTLVLLTRPAVRNRSLWVGVVFGLACLVKYQNVLLLPSIVLFYALQASPRDAVRGIAIVVGASTAVALPWLVRNFVVFGDPFYSVVRHLTISGYSEFGGEARFAASLDPPPSSLGYIAAHWQESLRRFSYGALTLLRGFFSNHAGSPVLLPVAAVGAAAAWRSWRRSLPLVAFAVLTVASASVTLPIARYVIVLVPLWLCLIGAGVAALIQVSAMARPWLRRTLGVFLVVVIVAAMAEGVRSAGRFATDPSRAWSPSANFGMLEAISVADYVRDHTAESEVVLSAETYHYAYVLGRSVVQIPYDERALELLRDRYRIRYLVSSVRDLRKLLPTWETSPPPWAELVYHVPEREIPRPPRNPSYSFVSEMRIYRIAGE